MNSADPIRNWAAAATMPDLRNLATRQPAGRAGDSIGSGS